MPRHTLTLAAFGVFPSPASGRRDALKPQARIGSGLEHSINAQKVARNSATPDLGKAPEGHVGSFANPGRSGSNGRRSVSIPVIHYAAAIALAAIIAPSPAVARRDNANRRPSQANLLDRPSCRHASICGRHREARRGRIACLATHQNGKPRSGEEAHNNSHHGKQASPGWPHQLPPPTPHRPPTTPTATTGVFPSPARERERTSIMWHDGWVDEKRGSTFQQTPELKTTAHERTLPSRSGSHAAHFKLEFHV